MTSLVYAAHQSGPRPVPVRSDGQFRVQVHAGALVSRRERTLKSGSTFVVPLNRRHLQDVRVCKHLTVCRPNQVMEPGVLYNASFVAREERGSMRGIIAQKPKQMIQIHTFSSQPVGCVGDVLVDVSRTATRL